MTTIDKETRTINNKHKKLQAKKPYTSLIVQTVQLLPLHHIQTHVHITQYYYNKSAHFQHSSSLVVVMVKFQRKLGVV